MDSLITAAARALAQGDPLGALKRIALRDDAPALALRGIAMAQLGDFARAKMLLKSAARSFGAKEAVSRARCIVAEAEIALASRDLAWPTKALDAAREELESHGDFVNAAHARQLEIRRLVLIGRLDDAERLLATLSAARLPVALRAIHELMAFGIAIRRLQIKEAQSALGRAQQASHAANIPALIAETDGASQVLQSPAAQWITQGCTRLLLLHEIETLLESKTLIIDACRYLVRDGRKKISLTSRPVLFALLRELAEAWPQDVSRNTLIAHVFRTKQADESHRVRLRVEIGRLRTAIKTIANVNATKEGFVLEPRSKAVAVLARPIDDKHADVLALLADGEAWSSSAAALALSASQRTVQRALESLASEGKVQILGNGRARRWITPPLPGFATTLLLPAPLPSD
jgi:DNA-binding winged helix-turn-helix (wHTH) protein